MSGWRRLAQLLAIVVVLVGACVFPLDPSTTWFEVANRTDEPLDIVYDRAGGLILAHEVAAGAKVNVTNPGEPACTAFDVVALDLTGTEIARHAPPLCTGDVWTIEPTP